MTAHGSFQAGTTGAVTIAPAPDPQFGPSAAPADRRRLDVLVMLVWQQVRFATTPPRSQCASRRRTLLFSYSVLSHTTFNSARKRAVAAHSPQHFWQRLTFT